MRYAFFSDIHGNIYALEAMLETLRHEPMDGYLFCGDFVGYYYHSLRVIQRAKQLPNFHGVCGNHDALYLEASTDSAVQAEAIKKYGSAYASLEEEVAQYLQTLPKGLILQMGGYRIRMLHGSPEDPLWGRIYPDTALGGLSLDCDFLLLGHTHYPMIKEVGGCKIVNPGSLGQPRDGKGFSYCILDFLTGRVERRLAVFDKAPLLKEITQRDPGMPYLSEVLCRQE